MKYYRSYLAYDIYLDEDEKDLLGRVAWKVSGYGSERSSGVSGSRQEAYEDACDSIETIEADPYRFPINLVNYPQKVDGDVVTRDGEIIGRWCMSGSEELEIVSFLPNGASEALFEEHFIGLLCSRIRDWYESEGAT